MRAIEFVSKAHNGVVDLPREQQDWNGKQVRVILLEVASEAPKRKVLFKAAIISTPVTNRKSKPQLWPSSNEITPLSNSLPICKTTVMLTPLIGIDLILAWNL